MALNAGGLRRRKGIEYPWTGRAVQQRGHTATRCRKSDRRRCVVGGRPVPAEIAEILKLSRSGKTPCERVLSIAHQHLAAVEERIRQLQSFRNQLAAELEKWDGKTSPTCEGLCQIISLADVRAPQSAALTKGRHAR